MIIFLLLIPLPCLTGATLGPCPHCSSCVVYNVRALVESVGTYSLSSYITSEAPVSLSLIFENTKNIAEFGMLLLINFIVRICLQYQYALSDRRVLHFKT